jgi:hypothetical protein
MVIAENYKLWLSCHFISVKPIAIAQQGRTDLWPKVLFYYQLKKIQNYAFKMQH